MALSPIRVDEILVMRREPSAGAGLGRIRRSPSVRGRQHVQVTEPKKSPEAFTSGDFLLSDFQNDSHGVLRWF